MIRTYVICKIYEMYILDKMYLLKIVNVSELSFNLNNSPSDHVKAPLLNIFKENIIYRNVYEELF